jgi:hypothetical protein
MYHVHFKLRKIPTKSNKGEEIWHKLLLGLSFCDFMQGLYYFSNFFIPFDYFEDSRQQGCVWYSILGMYFACASFLFTAAISWYIYEAVKVEAVGRKRHDISGRLYWLCWGYPLVVDGALLLWTTTHQADNIIAPEQDIVGCYIRPPFEMWKALTIYLPLWGCWAFTLFAYGLSVRRIRLLLHPAVPSTPRDNKNPTLVQFYKKLEKVQAKFIFIPLVFVFLRGWETIYRLVEISMRDPAENWWHTATASWLRFAQAIFNPAQGILNCVIFVVLSPKFDASCGAGSRSCSQCFEACGSRHYENHNHGQSADETMVAPLIISTDRTSDMTDCDDQSADEAIDTPVIITTGSDGSRSTC